MATIKKLTATIIIMINTTTVKAMDMIIKIMEATDITTIPNTIK
jgi:hypothetical protein